MNNHIELREFVGFWRGSDDFEVDPVGNCEFNGQISYSWKKEIVVETTTVRLIRNGYGDGKVHLSETKMLSAERFHLDFSPDFQTYEFRTSDGALTVSGQSPKMMGPYTVTIVPVLSK
ncbi:hypothetical protein [Ralstonia solanacearum]|uniref:hypothetical protein n=1 Tax=Ralstonia solanacearum TaxID=305 RepID=UPI0009B8B726|nr:hypothetical protein [Ralstonia solanacearum]